MVRAPTALPFGGMAAVDIRANRRVQRGVSSEPLSPWTPRILLSSLYDTQRIRLPVPGCTVGAAIESVDEVKGMLRGLIRDLGSREPGRRAGSKIQAEPFLGDMLQVRCAQILDEAKGPAAHLRGAFVRPLPHLGIASVSRKS